MIRKLKMLILKIVFIPLWLLAPLSAIFLLLLHFIDKGMSIAFNREPEEFDWNDFKKNLKETLEYWRL